MNRDTPTPHAIYTEQGGKKIVVIGTFDGAHVTIGDHARHKYAEGGSTDPLSALVEFFAAKVKGIASALWTALKKLGGR